jgi:hypothetical protein
MKTKSYVIASDTANIDSVSETEIEQAFAVQEAPTSKKFNLLFNYDSDILDIVNKELINILTNASLTPDNSSTQVLTAIKSLGDIKLDTIQTKTTSGTLSFKNNSGLITGRIFDSGFFAPTYLGRELLSINSPASGSTHTFDIDIAYIPSGSSDYVYQRFIKIFIQTAVGGSGDHQMDEYNFCITSVSQTLQLIKTNNYSSTPRFSLVYTSSSGFPDYKRTLTVTILTSGVDNLKVSMVVFQ